MKMCCLLKCLLLTTLTLAVVVPQTMITCGLAVEDSAEAADLAEKHGSPATLVSEAYTYWYTIGNTYIRSTFVADVDGDGSNEIVTGGWYLDGTRDQAQVRVLRWTGTSWTGEGVVHWYNVGDTHVDSVFVRDVDGDSQNEIITAGRFWDGTRWRAQIRVLRWTGSTMIYEGHLYWYSIDDTHLTSVFADDVDGDGQIEIVTGGYFYDGVRWRAQIRVLRWTGTSWISEGAVNWYSISHTDIWSIFVEDVDGDGQKEIVTAGTYEDLTGPNPIAQLRVLRWTGSAFVSEGVKNWRYLSWSTGLDSVIVADVDGDGQKEIVTAGWYFYGAFQRAYLRVLRWTGSAWASEGELAWYTIGNTRLWSVRAADVDGDGQIEIVTGGYFHDGTRCRAQLRIYRWTGSAFIGEASTYWYSGYDTEIESVFIGDVDGDIWPEIISGGWFFDGTRDRAFVRIFRT